MRIVSAVAGLALIGIVVFLWKSGQVPGRSASGGDLVLPTVNQTAVDNQDAARSQLDDDDPFSVGSKRRLWEELPFALVKSRAEQGDAEAQWLLSLMYDYCFSYNLKPAATLQGMDVLAGLKPESASGLGRIKKELVERCATVDNGAPIPSEAVTLWLKQSADQGYITAKLRQAVLSQESNPEILLSLVREIEASPPQAIFEMGTLARLIEPHWQDPVTSAAFSKGQYAEYAWQIAACRAGLDCSQSSLVMFWACQQGACGYANYEQYVINGLVSPSGRKELERTISLIQRQFLK